jgi:hypothetical protein
MRFRLKQIIDPIRKLAGRFVMLPPPPKKFNRDTILFKAASFVAAERIAGDYLEFGVFAGRSLSQAFASFEKAFMERSQLNEFDMNPEESAKLLKLWKQMRFFGFDSFQGLPTIKGLDERGECFAEGHYRASKNEVLANLKKSGVPSEKVTLVEGWYDHTLTRETADRHNIRAAAVIHVDCDLYESTKPVMDFVKPFLTDGTVIIFDDWYCFKGNPDLGEQRAFREFQEELPDWVFTEYQKEGPFRASFIATKKQFQLETRRNFRPSHSARSSTATDVLE